MISNNRKLEFTKNFFKLGTKSLVFVANFLVFILLFTSPMRLTTVPHSGWLSRGENVSSVYLMNLSNVSCLCLVVLRVVETPILPSFKPHLRPVSEPGAKHLTWPQCESTRGVSIVYSVLCPS